NRVPRPDRSFPLSLARCCALHRSHPPAPRTAHPPSVRPPPPGARPPPPGIRHLPSAIRHLPSGICRQPFLLFHSAFRIPNSAEGKRDITDIALGGEKGHYRY